MEQKMIINVDTPLSVSSLKDGDILIYDATKKNFYVTTKKSLFQQEQKEREEYQKYVGEKLQFMEKSYAVNLEELTNRVNTAIEEYNSKYTELENKYNNFLEQYKESNAKIIEMVEELVKGE